MTTFKAAAQDYLDETTAVTKNGMAARTTTASAVLDFFSKAGSYRGTDLSVAFKAALAENEQLAIRALLWTRDITSGAGERKQFRDLLKVLEKVNPALAERLMVKIPVLGRWDDLFSYQDPINRSKALRMYAEALISGNGLAAKWAPREKSAKRAIAKELRSVLGMSPRQYRKLLANATNVVETQMCAKEWEQINFSHVPSLASARYQKAFGRNAGEAYSAYLRELQKPQSERNPSVKINAGAVYPYDVVKSVIHGNEAVADEQWKALPNYVGDAHILPLVDVSGSMGSLYYGHKNTVKPIDVAVSLGVYLSEKNTSVFKDMFMTFSSSPKLEILRGTLSQRIAQLARANWEMSTNIEAAFDQILYIAVKNNVEPEDMPEMLLILSDMQFNAATRYGYSSSGFNETALQLIKRKFRRAGYRMPKIVFWNLSAYGDNNTPVRFDDSGVCLVSGFSPAIMKSVLANDVENYTPYNVMLKTLSNSRYDY
jgi:hypothetical protein